MKPHVHSLARAAHEPHARPVYTLPNTCANTGKCSHWLSVVSPCTQAQRKASTSYQRSAINVLKKPSNTNTATYSIFAYLLNKKLWLFKAQSLITQHIFF